MAIIREFYKTREDGINLYRTYSDLFYKIKKIGTEEIYDEAIDIEYSNFQYEETDEMVEETSETVLKAQAYEIIIGERE
jgi:hypothetical protein